MSWIDERKFDINADDRRKRARDIEGCNRLLARLMIYHSSNPPDEEVAKAVARIRGRLIVNDLKRKRL